MSQPSITGPVHRLFNEITPIIDRPDIEITTLIASDRKEEKEHGGTPGNRLISIDSVRLVLQVSSGITYRCYLWNNNKLQRSLIRWIIQKRGWSSNISSSWLKMKRDRLRADGRVKLERELDWSAADILISNGRDLSAEPRLYKSVGNLSAAYQ